jgi:alcohol sulfotransferase
MNLWAREQGRMKAFMMVRYEDLKADPAGVLDRVARFLGTPGSAEAIAEAVGYASFKNMRKLEQSQAFGADDRKMAPGDRSDLRSYKVRRAKIGGYRDYYTPAQVEEIDALDADRLSPGLGYGAEPPPTDLEPKASDGSH